MFITKIGFFSLFLGMFGIFAATSWGDIGIGQPRSRVHRQGPGWPKSCVFLRDNRTSRSCANFTNSGMTDVMTSFQGKYAPKCWSYGLSCLEPGTPGYFSSAEWPDTGEPAMEVAPEILSSGNYWA